MSSGAPQLIEQAARSVLDEVTALKPVDSSSASSSTAAASAQRFRLELPEVKVTEDIATDARVRIEMRRDFFN